MINHNIPLYNDYPDLLNDNTARMLIESEHHEDGILNYPEMEHSGKLPADLSSKILTTGPDYHDHRGGVGAVIEIYSRYYEVFNFIPSYRPGSLMVRVYIFMICLLRLSLRLISDRKIKVIHIHGASNGSFYRKYIIFLIAKFLFGKKIIYHIHGGGFKDFYDNSLSVSKLLIRSLIEKADTVLCLSESWFEFYKSNFKTRRLVILPNIIDYPSVRNKNTNNSYTRFLFLGLIGDAKGIFDLLKVITKNKERLNNRMKLLIGGNGEVKRLIDFIKTNQIENIVEFMGWVTNDTKISAFNNADICILPSYNEGMPIFILEAMSYGLAIISTNVGGIPEIVINEVNGLLIEPGHHDQLEQSLNYLIDNPALIKKYGAASENLVRKHYPDKICEQLIETYNHVA